MNNVDVILLVEDDINILRTNSRILKREGFEVLCANNLASARKLLETNVPDALVLDIMLPDGSGLDFCQEIRPKTLAPVLFLTALDEKSEIINGLVAGGNDYITKPYDIDEFLARIKAQISLARMNRESSRTNELLDYGPLSLDLSTTQVFLNKTDMLLSPREFAVLYFLLKNEGVILSTREIYEEVWKQPMVNNPSALWKCISRLKSKLEISNGSVSLTNYRNEGYVLEIRE